MNPDHIEQNDLIVPQNQITNDSGKKLGLGIYSDFGWRNVTGDSSIFHPGIDLNLAK